MAEKNRATVRAYLDDMINRGDLSQYDKYFPEQVSFNGSELSREQMEGIVRFFRDPFPDIHITVEDQFAEGDKVATRLKLTGTHLGEVEGIPPTSKKVEFTGLAIDRIVDGKVVEMWHEIDYWGMIQQLRKE